MRSKEHTAIVKGTVTDAMQAVIRHNLLQYLVARELLDGSSVLDESSLNTMVTLRGDISEALRAWFHETDSAPFPRGSLLFFT